MELKLLTFKAYVFCDLSRKLGISYSSIFIFPFLKGNFVFQLFIYLFSVAFSLAHNRCLIFITACLKIQGGIIVVFKCLEGCLVEEGLKAHSDWPWMAKLGTQSGSCKKAN